MESKRAASPYTISQNSLASATESLNGENFSLFHFISIVIFDERNLLTAILGDEKVSNWPMTILQENVPDPLSKDIEDDFWCRCRTPRLSTYGYGTEEYHAL